MKNCKLLMNKSKQSIKILTSNYLNLPLTFNHCKIQSYNMLICKENFSSYNKIMIKNATIIQVFYVYKRRNVLKC